MVRSLRVSLQNSQLLPWLITVVAASLAIFVWGESNAWRLSDLSIYQIFPALGLFAFSVMWSHYMAGFMKRVFLRDVRLGSYFRWTGYAVLVALLLHPGLLAYQRFRDGFGVPPGSELSYVMPKLAWVVVLGMVSLLIFLAFELHRWFRHKPWWFIVPRLGDAAMLAIFYHGLRLGTQTHIHWFRAVWWFYGLTLLAVLVHSYSTNYIHKRAQRNP